MDTPLEFIIALIFAGTTALLGFVVGVNRDRTKRFEERRALVLEELYEKLDEIRMHLRVLTHPSAYPSSDEKGETIHRDLMQEQYGRVTESYFQAHKFFNKKRIFFFEKN